MAVKVFTKMNKINLMNRQENSKFYPIQTDYKFHQLNLNIQTMIWTTLSYKQALSRTFVLIQMGIQWDLVNVKQQRKLVHGKDWMQLRGW